MLYNRRFFLHFFIYNIFIKKKSEASTIIYAISSDPICMGEVIRDLREKIIEFNKLVNRGHIRDIQKIK